MIPTSTARRATLALNALRLSAFPASVTLQAFAKLVVNPRLAVSIVSRSTMTALSDIGMTSEMVKEVMARVSGGAVAVQGATVTVDSPRSDY